MGSAVGVGRVAVACAVAWCAAAVAAPPAEAAPPFAFRRTDYAVRILPDAALPYHASRPGPLDGTGTYDRAGVSVRIVNGRAYDHPVLQAQFMLTRLSSYRHNRDPRYLARVRAHGARLLATAVHARGAMYFPYHFDWALHGDRADMMAAPWYSAMAQGQVLSAFLRLHAVTGDARYAAAAAKVFASFTLPRVAGAPWTVDVDGGHLWFEEYAKHPGPDRAFNGHVFAIFGLYDYYRFTGSATAKALLQGGVTAVEGKLGRIRVPGWLSRYCLSHPGYAYPNYHTVHVGQLYQLHAITGASSLAVAADRFLDDYPAAQLGGRGYLAAGVHRAHRLDAARRIVETRSFDLAAPAAVTVAARHRIAGAAGVWLQVGTGPLAGYWVPETHGRSFVKLGTETYAFTPRRTVLFAPGAFTGYTFDALGLRATAKTFTLAAASRAHTDRRTVMNGVPYVHVTDGVWAGRWVPTQPRLTLR